MLVRVVLILSGSESCMVFQLAQGFLCGHEIGTTYGYICKDFFLFLFIYNFVM